MSTCIDDTSTIDLDITGGVLTADLIISPDDENAAEARANGLYVSAAGVPVASIIPTARTAAPAGWLMCDGAAVSRSTYDDLFAEIGETFGAGDATTTFNVPDLRGRVAVGKGIHADVNALGENEGSAAADRRPKHPHTDTLTLTDHIHDSGTLAGTITDPALKDGGAVTGPDAAGSAVNQGTTVTISGDTGDPTTNPSIDGAVGVAGTADDAPAYIVLNYIIKT